MGSSDPDQYYQNLSGLMADSTYKTKNEYNDFAYAKFTVDYKARSITSEIIGAKSDDKGKSVDKFMWYFDWIW